MCEDNHSSMAIVSSGREWIAELDSPPQAPPDGPFLGCEQNRVAAFEARCHGKIVLLNNPVLRP
jgi:hypothetical protein